MYQTQGAAQGTIRDNVEFADLRNDGNQIDNVGATGSHSDNGLQEIRRVFPLSHELQPLAPSVSPSPLDELVRNAQ